MTLRRIVALLLVFVLVAPINAFAITSTDNSSLDPSKEQLSWEELKAITTAAREKSVRQLSKLGKLLSEDNDLVINENSVNPDLYFKADDKVRVIIEVSGKPVHSLKNTSAVNKLKQAHSSVIASMKDGGIDADIRHHFVRSVNGFSAVVKYSDIAEIKKMDGVEKIYISRKYSKDMNTSREMVNADIVNKATANGGLDLKGEGILVAIVDTGIDHTHRDLSDITDASKAKYPDAASIKSKLDATKIDDDPDTPEDKWYNEKVVSGYDWADMDDDVIPDLSHPLASPHGVHVAGIVAANAGTLDLDEYSGRINGIAPEAQLLAEKVFSDDDEYAYDDDIIAGINHAIDLDADVINMSLGDVAGFVGADADPIQKAVDEAVNAGIIVCVSAGNSGHNTKGVYSTWPYPLAQDPDIGLAGSPGVGENTLQVASYENDIIHALLMSYSYDGTKKGTALYQVAGNVSPTEIDDIELVYCGLGGAADFTPDVTAAVVGKVALIERGTYDFAEKQINAQKAGAVGVVVYNHSSGGEGLIAMATHPDLGIPAVFVGRTTGLALMAGIDDEKKVSLEFFTEELPYENPAKGRMMDGSSWGVTPNLDFKPEITAPGGNVYSTVNNDEYESMSGTSMSSPAVAGAAALVAQYLASKGVDKDADLVNLAKTMLINTAETITNPISEGNTPYSPRLQGSGLMQVDKAISTPVTVKDKDKGKAAVSLYEIDTGTGIENFTLQLRAFSDLTVSDTVYYNVYANIFTDFIFEEDDYCWNGLETAPVDGAAIKVNSGAVDSTVYQEVYVERGSTTDINITLDLKAAELSEESFVEGFISFVPTSANPDIPTLTVPYVGFYGAWDKPRNVDPGIWDADCYAGYTGLYDAVPSYDENDELLGYDLYQLGEALNGDVDPQNAAFSPNGDATQDTASTVFTLLRNAKRFKLYVKDGNGDIVRKIFDNTTWANEGGLVEYKAGIRKNHTYGADWFTFRPGAFDWDGTFDDGSLAPDGDYTMIMETTIDYKGADSQIYELPVQVDTVEPVIDALEVAKAGGGYTISWAAADNDSGICYTAVLVDGTLADIVDSDSMTIDSEPGIVVIITFDYAGNAAMAATYYNTINPAAATFDLRSSAQKDISVTISGSELKGITLNNNALVLGTDYTVSDSTVTIMKKYLAKLATGTATFTFDFDTGNDCELKVTVINTTPSKDDDDDNGGGGGSTAATTGTPQTPASTLDSTGTARISMSKEALNTAIAAAAVNAKGIKEVVIPVARVEGAKAYLLSLPSSALLNTSGSAALVFHIQTELGTLTLPDNMLTSDMAAQGDTVGISIGVADTSGLPADLKALIGDRPVFDLKLEVNGVKKAWNNPDAPVTVSVPYKPTAEELSNPDSIVVWYLDPVTNTPVAVPNCKYDPATGKVTFVVTHFSLYAVTYVKPVIDDIGGYTWADRQIKAMVAKDILKQTGKNEFNPKTEITRGDFMFGLVRALGLSCKVEESFEDVGTTDYYYNELGIARKLGITSGIGNNKFNPYATITRQDMMTMISRALVIAKKNTGVAAADLSQFADHGSIAAYAQQSVETVVAEGIIVGDGKNINPLGNVTRAEAAVIMYRIFGR